VEIPVAVVIAISIAAFLLPAAGIFLIPRLAKFLKSKGLDDETLEFIDLIDDYFDEVEDLAEASGIKGAEKLAKALTGMVEKLGRELTAKEKAVAVKRIVENAQRKKGIRPGGSIRLDDAGM